jgi:hypothetical protein
MFRIPDGIYKKVSGITSSDSLLEIELEQVRDRKTKDFDRT